LALIQITITPFQTMSQMILQPHDLQHSLDPPSRLLNILTKFVPLEYHAVFNSVRQNMVNTRRSLNNEYKLMEQKRLQMLKLKELPMVNIARKGLTAEENILITASAKREENDILDKKIENLLRESRNVVLSKERVFDILSDADFATNFESYIFPNFVVGNIVKDILVCLREVVLWDDLGKDRHANAKLSILQITTFMEKSFIDKGLLQPPKKLSPVILGNKTSEENKALPVDEDTSMVLTNGTSSSSSKAHKNRRHPKESKRVKHGSKKSKGNPKNPVQASHIQKSPGNPEPPSSTRKNKSKNRYSCSNGPNAPAYEQKQQGSSSNKTPNKKRSRPDTDRTNDKSSFSKESRHKSGVSVSKKGIRN
jgi:hypothetical protein